MIFQISYNWGWNIYLRILVKFTLCWTPSTTLRFGRQHTSKLQFNTFHDYISFTIRSCDDEHYYHYQWHPRDGGHACRLPQGGRLDIWNGGETWSHVRTHKTSPPPSGNLICPILDPVLVFCVSVSSVVVRSGQRYLDLIVNSILLIHFVPAYFP